MGVSSSKSGCCGGFHGLQFQGNLKPDSSPTQARRVYGKKVETLAQALEIERPKAGSFSPKVTHANLASPKDWASPAPRPYQSPIDNIDLDMIGMEIELDADKSPARQRMASFDTDGPQRRTDACSSAVRERRSK